MKILVTGGAGFIGSFMVRLLLDKGYEVVVFDSLERGRREVVDSRAKFVQGDIKSLSDLERIFGNDNFDALMHFAAFISVEESQKDPEKYFQNNVIGSENLFTTAAKRGVNKFIFSSSAAVYGNPQTIPIPEDHPKNPTSEYGKNKLEMEKVLEKLIEENKDISFAALRYFNAAGAALDGSFGEQHEPETHIIPLAIRAVLKGSEFKLYGNDYNTPDGTCIRDYIHVLDLTEAHILALEKINKDPGGYAYNVGTGVGRSNKEVIDMIQKVSGSRIEIHEEARRPGDADRLVADPSKINNDLGFSPKYSDLKTIVNSAWLWHKQQFKV